MTIQERLIEAMRNQFPGDSQAALAKRAGLSQQRFNNYALGTRRMDVDAVIGCAQALDWDVRKAVSEHLEETAATPRVRAYWRKVVATASVLLLVSALSLDAQAEAMAPAGVSATSNVHYAKSTIGFP